MTNKEAFTQELEVLLANFRGAHSSEVAQFLTISTQASNVIARAAEQICAIAEPLLSAVVPLTKLAIDLGLARRKCDRFCETGWLPHSLAPLDLASEIEDDQSKLEELIAEHYHRCWPDIRQRLTERVDGYCVDDATKKVFQQSLMAHEGALYALPARALFPEIERATRGFLHNGNWQPITSQPLLREAVGNLPASDFGPGGFYSLELFGYLVEHVYVHVDPKNFDQIKSNPMPNRHAALHGFLNYDSEQSSLNAIFFAEFVFELLTILRGKGVVKAAA